GGRFCYVLEGAGAGDGIKLTPSAIGILCNLFLGRKAGDLTGGAEFLSENKPAWDKTIGEGLWGKKFPMYYTYYGTLAMFQLGQGYWKPWNKALKEALLPHQRNDGDEAGSWD